MSLSIHTVTAAELDEAVVVARDAYAIPTGRELAVPRYLSLQPDGWFLARLDGSAAGLVGTIDYGPVASVGMMSVVTRFQRRGIARALMAHLIAWLDERHSPSALLDATPPGAPLYQQLGFVEVGQTAQWSRTLDTAVHLPPPLYVSTGGQLTPVGVDDIAELCVFDSPIFGADRSRVLVAYISDDLERVFVIRDTATLAIRGYLIAQPRTIGPWVAQTAADAELLLRQALVLPFRDNVVGLNISQANEQANRLLAYYGFRQQRVLSHMHRKQVPARDLTKLYGQTNFALG